MMVSLSLEKSDHLFLNIARNLEMTNSFPILVLTKKWSLNSFVNSYISRYRSVNVMIYFHSVQIPNLHIKSRLSDQCFRKLYLGLLQFSNKGYTFDWVNRVCEGMD